MRRHIRKPEINLQIILDAIVDYAIFMLDKNGIVSTWNRGAERLKGYTAGEIIGRHFSTFYIPDDIAAKKPEKELQVARETGRYEEEGWRKRKDGSLFWANIILTPIYDERKRLRGFAKVTRNFDDRRRLLEALRRSEERFRLLVQGVKDYAIFMLLPDGTIASWNDGAQRAKGYRADEIIGQNFSIFYTPEDRAKGKSEEMLRIAQAEGRVEDEGWRVRKDGTRFWADVVLTAIKDERGELVGFAKVTRDVTERKNAEQTIETNRRQIVELQKLEAIGRLAGGIAHDFNNLISGILGCAEMLGEECAGDASLTEEIQEIVKACHRAGTLTRQLLGFTRRQIATPVVLDPNHEIEELRKMMTRVISSEIDMKIQLAATVPSIKMDPSQFQQVVLNLVLNARDALPKGGRIYLGTSRATIDELANTQDLTIAQGDYVMLTIADTGVGMAPDVRQHIFEPFYTTKEVGKGTGLGLATVYGVVKQNHGSITVVSRPGLGTTFKVFMPAHSEGMDPKPSPEKVPLQAPAPEVKGTETILVAEDDSLVLRNIVRFLQSLGYTVLAAPDGEKALALAEKVQGKIDLMITDVIMPNINGKELADKIREGMPTLPIIFMSGFSADLIADHGILKEGVTFIEKPFNSHLLAEKVRSLLGPLKN